MDKKSYKTITGTKDAQIAVAAGVTIHAVRLWTKLPSRHALALVALAKQRGVEISAEEILS